MTNDPGVSLIKETIPPIVLLWINGEAVKSSSEVTFEVHSAKRDEIVSVAQSATPSDAAHAADVSLEAFALWRQTSANHRREIILKAADIFESRRSELVAAQVEETSCEAAWAGFNLSYGLDNMREIASQVTSVFGEIPSAASSSNLAMVLKEPVGPSLLISPWNAAVVLSLRGICCMLAAGCTCVFKASEQCPRTHHLLAEVLTQAGLPSGVLNVIQCRREDASAVTEELISHDAIKKVEFIGSAAVGKIIGQFGGKYLKPVLMELGGKCPALVLDDANLKDAAEKCVRGAFMHHGQICFSTERIIVLKSVADEFIPLLKKAATAFAPGSGGSRAVVDKAHASLVEAQSMGAEVLVGGPRYAGPAELVPTIMTGVTKGMKLFDQETFGPSTSLYIAENEDEAIAIANDTPYGLNASIHTTNMWRALNVAKRLEVGQVHINSLTTYNEATFPIGGTKGSGWGRNNSRFGIDEFIQKKTISFNMVGTKISFGG